MRTILQLMNMNNCTTLITGATGGLGQYMAETIAELGGDIVLVDQPGSSFKSLLEKIKMVSDVDVDVFECDLESKTERIALVDYMINNQKGLDILINNAAFVGTSNLQGWNTKFEEQSVGTWTRALEVNLTAVFDLTKGLSPMLKINGNGSIINIASIYGVCGPDYSLYEGTSMGSPAAYAASKGGLIQLTRWLSTTLAPEVRVNCISPGGVFRNQPESFVVRYEKNTPLKRMAIEDDFKGVTAYLASDLSQYMTGQNLLVDGGWTV